MKCDKHPSSQGLPLGPNEILFGKVQLTSTVPMLAIVISVSWPIPYLTNDQQQTPNPIRGAQGAGPVCCKCGYERDLHSPGGRSLWEGKGGGVGGPGLCVSREQAP